MELNGLRVLITGSSLGIGRATAIEFARYGAIPIITYYKDKEKARSLVEEIKKHSIDTKAYYLNLMENQSILSLVDSLKNDFGKIDVLVNNAGVIYWKSLLETSFNEIEEQSRVNLEGLIKMTKVSLELLTPKMIINVASGAGKKGYPNLATYCATKFGVIGFSEAISKELDIKVRVINPGSTKTRMTNYKGVPPEEVARIIVKVAREDIDVFEVNIWDYLG